jgi:hypothetical protein
MPGRVPDHLDISRAHAVEATLGIAQQQRAVGVEARDLADQRRAVDRGARGELLGHALVPRRNDRRQADRDVAIDPALDVPAQRDDELLAFVLRSPERRGFSRRAPWLCDSTSTPASLRRPTRTSFGHFSTASGTHARIASHTPIPIASVIGGTSASGNGGRTIADR